MEGNWERRWHPLRREWVVYAAHRNTRPWDGLSEAAEAVPVAHDPTCFLCPGNRRIHGEQNPNYEGVWAFDNDHPVVGPHAPGVGGGVGRREPARGRSRVICYHPRHDFSLGDLALDEAAGVMDIWAAEVAACAADPVLRFALLFENRGAITGTSSLHPHGQLYGTDFVFKHVEMELEAIAAEADLFARVLDQEQSDGLRIVAANAHAVAFVPWFARWSFEVWIFPRERCARLDELDAGQRRGLMAVYLQVIRRYDALYQQPFPYVMSLYQAPFGGDYPDYHLHFVLLPPLRQPGIRKFPAGPEIGGGNFMNDLMPETAAAQLQAAVIGEVE